MPKAHAFRKTPHDAEITAKAGKDRDAITETRPRKAPGRTQRQAGGMRASTNRAGRKRTKG